jgi:mono/diheme cytochrome c family protein
MYTKLKLVLIVTALATTAALPATQQPVPNSSAVSAGEALFFGKAGCGTCHEVNGRGGVMGPDLSAAAWLAPQ